MPLTLPLPAWDRIGELLRRRAWRAAAAGLAIAVLIGAWVFTQQITGYGIAVERAALAQMTAAAAASLDPAEISKLTGTPSDEGGETLALVRARLHRIHDSIPRARFVYLMTLREGRVIFLADAEAPSSRDYSPPGQVYREAPDGFREAFHNAAPRVHGPYRDRWGEWITGLAPLHFAGGGPVLGVDISADNYLAEVDGYRWFALAISALFAACVTLAIVAVWLLRRYNNRLEADLAEQCRVQDHLRLSAAVIENMTEGVMITDAHLHIQSVNPAFANITGYSAVDALGRKPRILFSGRHDDAFFHRLHDLVDANGNWRGEIWNRRSDGRLYPQRTSVSVIRDGAGNICNYASLISDNTAQHELEARLREMSSVDGVTGIANRRAFDEVLAREWSRASRDGRTLSLLMADIDFFKGYNDRHGHLGGDQCLRQVARAIDGAVNRSSDLAARYGGEEFAVILPEADAAAAAGMGEKIRAAVAALALPHGGSGVADFVTISVGVATLIPLPSTQATDLIAAADRALYQAKHAGRNRVMCAGDLSASGDLA